MSPFRFPGESDAYREARDELLEMEVRLRAQTEAVAQKRRELPLGGKLKEDYRFEKSDGSSIEFAELFGPHDTLLLYSMMFGPEWDAPCPACTSIVDGFAANAFPVNATCATAAVANAKPEQLREWSEKRGWHHLTLVSGTQNSYLVDYCGWEGCKDAGLVSIMNVFKKTSDGVFHTWGSELLQRPMENGHPRHADPFWPLYNLLDLTPGGRGEKQIPVQNYSHDYFSANVFSEEEPSDDCCQH